MTCSRSKGAAFERKIAGLLKEELGISFRRHLSQYQENDLGDLQADDPTWPYEVEIKRYAKGPIDGAEGWWHQVVRAATKSGKEPALIYKYDRQPTRCVVVINGIKCNVSFDEFCKLARERMAENAGY